jgi:hypothetical protein
LYDADDEEDIVDGSLKNKRITSKKPLVSSIEEETNYETPAIVKNQCC